MKKKLHRILLFLLLANVDAVAQTTGFNYEASIKPVDSSGFYNIVLKPELNAHLKIDYSDLRVVNDLGKWVPHLVREPNGELKENNLTSYIKILENKNTSDFTKIILKSNGEVISNLVFTIKNTDAKRYCTLAGSDNMDTWFTINDSMEIIPKTIRENGYSIFYLLFSEVKYKYFKLLIKNNTGNDGINIVSAGTEYFLNALDCFSTPGFINPIALITQKDSGKTSFIKVEQEAPYQFNQFKLKLSGAKHFNRNAELFIANSALHSFNSPGQLVKTFIISNNNLVSYKLPLSKARAFYIVIHNEDNLPLKIEEVETRLSYSVASVYLDKQKTYKLLLDNESSSVPNYDLSIQDIPVRKILPTATVGKIVSIQKPVIASQSKPNSKKLIWLSLAIAAIVLGFFTYRLITDMNKQKT